MKEEKLVKKSIYFFKMRFHEIYSMKKQIASFRRERSYLISAIYAFIYSKKSFKRLLRLG